MRTNTLFSILSLALGVALLAGCAMPSPTAITLPEEEGAQPSPLAEASFASIVQGDTSTPPESLAAQSGVLVASDLSQLSNLVQGFVDEGALERLSQAIAAGDLVVVVFGEGQPSSGYGLSVQSLEVNGDQVSLETELSAPEPGAAANDVISYPFQILVVPRENIPAGEVQWQLADVSTRSPDIKPVEPEPKPVEPLPRPELDKANAVEFISVYQGDQFNAPEPVEQPAIIPFPDNIALSSLFDGLDPALSEKILAYIAKGMVPVLVYQGMQATGGYTITTQAVSVAGDQVVVVAQLGVPASDQMVTQVITYPFELIMVPQQAVQSATTWTLLDTAGNALAQNTLESVPPKQPVSGAVPFTSLAQGSSMIAPQGVEAPAIFVAGDPAAAAGFLPNDLGESSVAQIQQAGKQGMLTVAVYRGQMDTGGYGVRVNSVMLQGDKVIVAVSFIDPRPDLMVNQVISYPYEIILVPQSPVPSKATWVMVDSNGTPLAQTTTR